MGMLTRRELLWLGLAASAGLAPQDADAPADLHTQLLDLAARFEQQRRARFAAVATRPELDALQASLRAAFLQLLGGLPERPAAPPAATTTGRIEADDHTVEKLVFESLPGVFVPALLYRPRPLAGPAPGVLSPCGHSPVGKAADPYQILHVNLARRGFVVLTYDPVGQGERSQFWDAERRRSRFNLVCGEHAVLGNPLYLLGTSLARFRIGDGLRGLDYLAALPEVHAARIGCVGNSGGGNLTAYIAALDPRVAVAAICCYITTLPLRMGNRIQDDPDADPEQDLFGFVSAGIDHAGLLALLAPRPTLLGTARDDFFPIAGARASFAEAQRLYEVAGAEGRIERVEAPGRHGLSVTLRQAVYAWFERWLLGREPADADAEIPVRPRTPAELLVCPEGQVNVSFRSRPLLPLALEEFHKQPPIPRRPLRQLLRLDLDQARPRLTETVAGRGAGALLIVGIDGNEAPRWNQERGWLDALSRAGHRVVIAEPRGVGASRPRFTVPGRAYADPLTGVEENLAYNAFLVGRSLLGMRVADVLTALARLRDRGPSQPTVLCGRRDAALVACFAAAVEPTVQAVALEEPRLSFRPLFRAEGSPINAASILPNLLRDFGDLPEVLARIAPRKVLVSAPIDEPVPLPASVLVTPQRFTQSPALLIDWLAS